MVRRDQAAHLMDRLSVREQRSGMTIRAHAQLDQIKSWRLRALEPKGIAQLRLIPSRRDVGLELALHAVNLRRAHRHMVEHRLARHAEIRVGVVRRNAALIHPEELQLVPRHARPPGLSRIGQQRESSLRRRAAAHRDARPAARLNCCFDLLHKILRRACGERRRIGDHIILNFELPGHNSPRLQHYITRPNVPTPLAPLTPLPCSYLPRYTRYCCSITPDARARASLARLN